MASGRLVKVNGQARTIRGGKYFEKQSPAKQAEFNKQGEKRIHGEINSEIRQEEAHKLTLATGNRGREDGRDRKG